MFHENRYIWDFTKICCFNVTLAYRVQDLGLIFNTVNTYKKALIAWLTGLEANNMRIG